MLPSSYLADNFLLVGGAVKGGMGIVVDPTTEPARVDTLSLLNSFVAISPDRKWIASAPAAGGVSVQPWL